MNTSSALSQSRAHRIHMKPSQRLVIEQASLNQWLKVEVESGIIRLATEHDKCQNDITLAMMSHLECGSLRKPINKKLLVEAVTETFFELSNEEFDPAEDDVLTNWLLDLHIIRNPIKTEDRLKALFELLVERFGKRTAEGVTLDFLLPHSRLAEMIGSTRSTVSRSISTLRKSNQITIDETRNKFVWNLKS